MSAQGLPTSLLVSNILCFMHSMQARKKVKDQYTNSNTSLLAVNPKSAHKICIALSVRLLESGIELRR